MNLRTFGTALALAGALGLASGAAPVAADPIADFYKGKRIKMIIGSSPGGGYATYARLIFRLASSANQQDGAYSPAHGCYPLA